MSLPLVLPAGVVQTTTALPDGNSRFVAGLRYSSAGELHVTTTPSPTDVFLAARRVSALGQLVVGPGEPEARPYDVNGGVPSDARPARTGVVVCQQGAPAPTDGTVGGGIKVGELGGVYVSAGA